MIGWNWVSFLLLFLLLPTSFFHFKKIMRGKASPSSSTNSHKHSCKILDPNVYEVLNFFWPKLFIFFGVLPHYLKLWAVVCCCAIMEGLHMMLEWKKKEGARYHHQWYRKEAQGQMAVAWIGPPSHLFSCGYILENTEHPSWLLLVLTINPMNTISYSSYN